MRRPGFILIVGALCALTAALCLTFQASLEPRSGFYQVLIAAMALVCVLTEAVWRSNIRLRRRAGSGGRTAYAKVRKLRARAQRQSLLTRARPLARPAYITAIAVVVIAAQYLVLIGIAATWSGNSFLSLRGARPGLAVAHVISGPTVAMLLVVSVLYWTKNARKQRKLNRIHRAVNQLSTTLATVLDDQTPRPGSVGAVGAQRSVTESVHELLKDILDLTERNSAVEKLLFPIKGPRTAWIYVPDRSNTTFVCRYCYPDIAAYRAVKDRHRPAVWNGSRVQEIDANVAKAHRETKGPRLRETLIAAGRDLRTCASVTGYVFHHNSGAHFFTRIGEIDEADESYIQLLAEDERETHVFAAGAGIALKVGDRPVGVLMLYDTAFGAFLEADATTLGIYSRLLALLVDRQQQRSYNEMWRVGVGDE